MKGGIAMALLALGALEQAHPESLTGALSVATVIEEECGGNGALAALLAGATADAVLLPEPTDLQLLLGGVGVVWCEVTTWRTGAHAGNPGSQGSALDAALEIAEGLRALTERFEAGDADTRDPDEQYHFNVGEIRAGEWISSAPTTATLGARVGFPRDMPPIRRAGARARGGGRHRSRCRAAVRRLPRGGVSRARRRPVRDRGRARTPDDARRRRLRARRARRRTTRRFYVRRGIPAVCYGPRGRNLHAVDEAVELVEHRRGRPHAHAPDPAGGCTAARRDRHHARPAWATAPRRSRPSHLRNAGEHVADRLVTAIALGEYITGQRLPSERELAALLARQPRERPRGAAPARRGRVRRDPARTPRRRVRAGGVGPGVRGARAAHARDRLGCVRGAVRPAPPDRAGDRRDRRRAPRRPNTSCDPRREPGLPRRRRRPRGLARCRPGAAPRDRDARRSNRYLVDLSQQIRARVSLGFQAEPYSLAIRESAKVQHGAARRGDRRAPGGRRRRDRARATSR